MTHHNKSIKMFVFQNVKVVVATVDNDQACHHLCQQCHASFSSKSELQIHVLTEHAYKCALCNFTTKYDSLLVAHVQANHKDSLWTTILKGTATPSN